MNWHYIVTGSAALVGVYAAFDYAYGRAIRNHAGETVFDFARHYVTRNDNPRRARGCVKRELQHLEHTPTFGFQSKRERYAAIELLRALLPLVDG